MIGDITKFELFKMFDVPYKPKYDDRITSDGKERVVTIDLRDMNIKNLKIENITGVEVPLRVDLRENQISSVDISSIQNTDAFDSFDSYYTPLTTVIELNATTLIFDRLDIIFTLFGKLEDGEDFMEQFSTTIPQLNLQGRNLKKVNLTPIRLCRDLRLLNLYHNQLEELDLNPLKSCFRLQDLSFHSNNLTEIDFTPLGNCKQLQYLHFMNNNLDHLDLKPLQECHMLRKLDASNNKISEIDLSPLSNMIYLSKLAFSENNLDAIDLSPLKFCTGLSTLLIHSNMISSIDLTPLEQIPAIGWIDLHGNDLSEIEIGSLQYATNLNGFAISENPIETVNISALVSKEDMAKPKYGAIGGLGPGLYIGDETRIVIYHDYKENILAPDIKELVENGCVDWVERANDMEVNELIGLYHKAYSLMQNQNFQQAQEILEEVEQLLSEGTKIGNLYYDLSFIHYRHNRYDKAVEYIMKSLNFHPKNEYYWYLLMIFEQYSDIKLKPSQIKSLVSDDLGPMANTVIARIYYQARDVDQAEKYYNHAMSLDPYIEEVYIGLCSCYMTRNELDKATRTVETVLKLFPQELMVWNIAKDIYNELGDQERTDQIKKEISKLELKIQQ